MQTDIIYRKLNTLHYLLGLLLIFWMPLDDHFIPFLSLLWLLSGAIQLRPRKLKGIGIRWSYILLFTSFYLLHLISVAYSADQGSAWFEMEVKLPILFFPLFSATLLIYNAKERKKKIFLAFITGNFVASLICLGTALLGHDAIVPAHFRYQELSFFHHPSYFALYLEFSLAILLFYFLKGENLKQPFRILIIIVGVVFVMLMILLLSSRAGILGALFVLILKIFQWLMYQKWPVLVKTGILVASLAVLTLLISGNPRVKKMARRIPEIVNMDAQKLQQRKLKSSNVRLVVWFSSFDILEEHWPFGIGNGDVKNEISETAKENYLSKNNPDFNYNAHNQFLDSFVAMGIPGIAVLMGILIYPLVWAIRKRYWLLISLVMILFTNLLFESMINRQAGVVFMTFFLPLLFGKKQ